MTAALALSETLLDVVQSGGAAGNSIDMQRVDLGHIYTYSIRDTND